MTVAVFTFYLFAITVLIGGLMTVIARNPVHSVLWLILAFLSSAGLFVLLGAEFVAMLLIIVYVGAVAVLFLFVVMMLDVDFAELKAEMAKYMPLALLIGVIILMQLGLAFGTWDTVRWHGRPGRRAGRAGGREHGGPRAAALRPLLPAVPAGRADPAGRDDRGDRADAAPPQDIKRQDIIAQMMRDPARRWN